MSIDDLINKFLLGDVMEKMALIPDESVHCIVTSPPYWAVRDYGIEPTDWPEVTFTIFGFPVTIQAMRCQLGHEKQPMEFIGHMVYIFREARRILRKDGTLWLNMGDCYHTKSGGYNNSGSHLGMHHYISEGSRNAIQKINRRVKGTKVKDMFGIPWMLAFALRDDGWYLRQDIIWHKKNPMVESCKDRCTKSHEYIFLLTKSKKYYFDNYAISTEISDASVKRYMQDIENQKGSARAHRAQ